MPSTRPIDETAADYVVLCDAGDVIRFINQNFARRLGAPADRCVGARFAPDGDGGEPGDIRTFRTKMRDGDSETIVAWRLDVLEGGEKLYAGAVAPDLRDKQTTSDAQDSRMQIIATVSHELRTPLNGILGMSALLLDTQLTLNQRAYVEAMRESGTNLLALVNDILDFSKLDAGGLELEHAPFDPYSLAQSVVELLSPRAAEKGIEIASFVAPTTPRRLLGDEARLRQILLNLAGNAVKFTNFGGVTIEFHAEEAGAGLRLVGSVRDSGVGIAADALASVFDRYKQADADVDRRSQGTGLGLAISRRLAQAMGGDITVSSTAGVGSVFTFVVAAGEKMECAPPPRLSAPPIVIATASPVLARVLGLQLEAFGATDIAVANSAESAATALAERRGATFLCDLALAGEANGVDGALKTAARSLVLLAPTERAAIDAMRAKGFDGYLVKPIRQSTLMREVGRPAPVNAPAGVEPARPAFDRMLKVLLAEDNQINAILATTLIRRAGHRVDVAKNGEEAVNAAAAGGYDIVFMDMHMPVLDGLEASRRIRALAGGVGDVPIVALTANATATDRQRCMAAGMNDFLSKPFEAGDLHHMLARWGGVEALDAAS